MATKVEERPEWPANSVMVCHGSLWQIEGCNVEHAQIKEIRQGNDPLNVGMPSPSPNPDAPCQLQHSDCSSFFLRSSVGLGMSGFTMNIAATGPVL